MRHALLLSILLVATACTGPYRPRSEAGHVEPLRTTPTAEEPAAETETEPDVGASEFGLMKVREASVFDDVDDSRPRMWGPGEFSVVLRLSDEPKESNPYVLDDGSEMVANYLMDDASAGHAVESTLRGARMELSGSGGHGHIGIYVPYEDAERARRLLMRVPGAEIALPVDVPEGRPGVFWNVPTLPRGTADLELVAGTARKNAPTFDRGVALVAAAGIETQVLPRHGTRSLLVPTVRAADARALLGMFEGAVEATLAGPLPRGDLLLFPSPRVELPPSHAPGDGWETVAFHRDNDRVAAQRIYDVLDRAGMSAGGISNAGGASVRVVTSKAERARQILRVVNGARLERGYEEEVVGEFWIDGVDLPRITKNRGKAPRPGAGREWVAEHGTHDTADAWRIALVLEIGGFDAAGVLDRDFERRKSLDAHTTKLSVPSHEAEAARRLIRLLPNGDRIVR